MENMLKRFIREEEAQDLIEYALLAALIAVSSIAAMELLTAGAGGVFTQVIAALGAA